jgi:methyl-accepting chemotaxis protein
MSFLNTLQKKAVFIVAIIIFFTIAINTAVLTSISYGKYKKAIQAKTESVGAALREDLNKALSLGVPLYALDGLDAELSELARRDESIGYVMIVDASGKVLFHHNAGGKGRTLKDTVTREILSAKKDLIHPGKTHMDHAFSLLDADDVFVGALRIGVKSQAVKSQLYDLLSWSVITSLLCFFLSLMLVHFSISQFITRPIGIMESAAKQIAAGSLISEVSVSGNDELASLGNAINSISSNLKDMIANVRNIVAKVNQVTGDIHESSRRVLEVSDLQKNEIDETALSIEEMDKLIESVAETAGRLSESSGETDTAIIQMRTSITNVAQNSDTFNETAQETADSVEELIASIKHIASSVDNLSAASSQIATSIDEVGSTTNDIEERAKESVGLADAVLENARAKGLSASAASTEGMGIIKEGMEAIFNNINVLGKKASDIGEIIRVIDDVAGQTDLLGLNAAILAAKAGEHGRGFAVVASEIKELADRTSGSTRDIGALINSVQDDMASSVRTASEGMSVVDKGLALVEDVHDALNLIVESAQQSTEKARGIQRATSEEALIIKQIQAAVGSVSEQTETISIILQEQNRGSTRIVNAAEKVRELSQHVKTETNEQSDGSHRIAEASTSVTGLARQIAHATKTQREKSEHIVGSIEKVHNTTIALRDSSGSLDQAIKSLGTEAAMLLKEMQKFDI